MNNSKVSVVMPVFNAEKFIAEAIESVLSQSFKDFELVIIDDGSTDRSAEIISRFKDKRIIKLSNYQNLGLVPSLNKCLKISKGVYIARVDADDLNDKDRFRKQVDFLDKNSKYNLVGSNALLINDLGKIIGKIKNPEKDPKIRRDVIKWSNVVLHPSIMARRKDIEMVGSYRSFFNKGAEDYDLWFRLLSRGKFYNIQDNLIKRRYHGEACTRKFHFRVELMALIARLVNLPTYIMHIND